MTDPKLSGFNVTLSADLLGIGKAAEKFSPVAQEVVKAIAGGIGQVYEPVNLYLKTKAEGAANRQNAVADAKAYIGLDTRSPAVLDAMRLRLLNTEYRRQENIIQASQMALEYAQQITDQSHPIDEDFVAEWIDGIKDVSSEELRRIWAKLLAGAPTVEEGRVPKPAIDLLKQFDATLAREFNEIQVAVRPTGGWLATMTAGKLLGDYAEDIGIGRFVTPTYLPTALNWLSFQARNFTNHAGNFYVFELGARAQTLIQALRADKPGEPDCEEFLAQMPDMLRSLSHNASVAAIDIRVTQTNRKRRVFRAEFSERSDYILQAGAPDAVKAVGTLELEDSLNGHALRSALQRLADLSFIILPNPKDESDEYSFDDDIPL